MRRPIALALADAGKRLLVANRDSGSIVVLHAQKLCLLSEIRVGGKLSDMAVVPKGKLLLVADEEAEEIVVLADWQASLHEVRRLKVGPSPVSVRVSDDGGLATAACLWPRRLVVLDLSAAVPVSAILDLPFAPRRQLLVPGTSKLIVADAFGGKLAVIDVRAKKIESVRGLPAHNMRGLALDGSGKSLLLAHQRLNGLGHTTANEIQNSNVLVNNVRRFSLAAVLDPWADVMRDDRLYPVGDIDRGAGDPAELAEGPDGQILVTLAGVNELAIGRPEKAIWTRLPVGRRPTALVVDQAYRRAYVANTFSDSISVVDLQAMKVVAEVSLGATPKDLRPAERGEMLFYDGQLSHRAWFSCHSCHPDGHSNGLLNDNFSDGSFGTPKRVLSLLGVKDTGPWAWNGKMPDLETQVRSSLKSTMQGPAPQEDHIHDLTAFLRTLAPPPSMLKALGTIDPQVLSRGRQVFARQKCATCHTPPTYTSPKTYDVGLRDETGQAHFNPPSLRGLSQGGPYFHDGRALTLEEVFTRYRHELSGELSKQELGDLLHFLGSI